MGVVVWTRKWLTTRSFDPVNPGVRSNENNNRRSLLTSTILAPLLTLAATATNPSPAQASGVRGPIELLRPATRVKLYIDSAISICQTIKSDKANLNEASLKPIVEYLLEQEPSFMAPEEEKLSKRYLEIDTSSAWQAARLKEREAKGADIGIDYTTPYDRFNTAVQQWGDNRAFQILRQKQRGMEGNNRMRAAFNAYNNNLVFGDFYQLNAQGDAKKALVRNDALPNVNAVVVSDLDLRDLYRNQVLQNVEDAKAEVSYQLKTKEFDVYFELFGAGTDFLRRVVWVYSKEWCGRGIESRQIGDQAIGLTWVQ